MARLSSVFSNVVNAEDVELENVCKCLAYVGKSFSSEQPSNFRGISKDISPDFLASLLSLVLILKFLNFNFSFSFYLYLANLLIVFRRVKLLLFLPQT